MIQQISGLLSRLRKPGDKKYRWLILLGLAGVLLVGLSEWLPSRKAETPVADTGNATLSAAAVEAALEERIGLLLTRVQGVGDCQVMVTLEQGIQQIYAADTAVSTAGSSEQILTVATDNGPVGLPVTQVQPVVKGVAVVCTGGGDPVVCGRVTELVATVFNISSRRVCVVGTN